MIDKNKVDAVREYLAQEFPGFPVDDRYDFDLGAQAFKTRDDRFSMLLKIGENFIADNSAKEIVARLAEWEIPRLLRDHNEMCVLVTGNGFELLHRYLR